MEPVFITKNGKGDLAVMSIETYERLSGKAELYYLLEEGITARDNGELRSNEEVLKDIRKMLKT